MTKEEIIETLFDFCSEEGHRENYPRDFVAFQKDIENLINQEKRKEAIAFGEWIDENGYHVYGEENGIKWWSSQKLFDNGKTDTAVDSNMLYILYLQSIT